MLEQKEIYKILQRCLKFFLNPCEIIFIEIPVEEIPRLFLDKKIFHS